MKRKMLLVGLLGILLVLGLLLAGCDTNSCKNNHNCKAPGTTCGASKCAVKSYNTTTKKCDC